MEAFAEAGLSQVDEAVCKNIIDNVKKVQCLTGLSGIALNLPGQIQFDGSMEGPFNCFIH